jgi:hypothetical protein
MKLTLKIFLIVSLILADLFALSWLSYLFNQPSDLGLFLGVSSIVFGSYFNIKFVQKVWRRENVQKNKSVSS